MRRTKQFIAALLSFISYGALAQAPDGFEYGRNLFSVSPIQMSEKTTSGVGMQYEWFLGSGSKFSLYLPVAYSFGHSDPCDPSIKARVFYAYPGVKFYPAGYKHIVTYAVGPSLAFGQGSTNCDCSGTDVSATASDTKPKVYKPVTEVGAMINNSVSAQATDHFSIGAEIGIGETYINKEGGKDIGTDVMLQVNLKVGYRL